MVAVESALLKSIRLQLPEETLYWFDVLERLGVQASYLASRLFLVSAGNGFAGKTACLPAGRANPRRNRPSCTGAGLLDFW